MKNATKFLLALLLVSVISLTNSTVEPSNSDSPFESCWMYALNSAEQEGEYYGNYGHDDYVEAFDWYYEICQEAGVLNMGDPVFL